MDWASPLEQFLCRSRSAFLRTTGEERGQVTIGIDQSAPGRALPAVSGTVPAKVPPGSSCRLSAHAGQEQIDRHVTP